MTAPNLVSEKNPFAPIQYTTLEGYKITLAVRNGEDIIIELQDEDEFPVYFYSPATEPNSFYQLYSYASGFDGWYDISLAFFTHDRDINLCLYAHRGMNSNVLYSSEWDTPELNELWGKNKESELWTTLEENEILKLQTSLLSGQSHLYSLPQDGHVRTAYALPENNPLKGYIAFGEAAYSSDVMAEFVSSDATQPAQSIAFYEGENRIPYSDITHRFQSRKVGILSVSFNDVAERQEIDFSNAYPLERETINKLVVSGRISFAPPERTPLTTPLLFKKIASSAPAAEKISTPPTPL